VPHLSLCVSSKPDLRPRVSMPRPCASISHRLSFSFLRSDVCHSPASVFSRSPGTPRIVVKTSFSRLLVAPRIRLRAPFRAFKEHRVFLLSFLRSQGAPRRILSLSSFTPACPRISGLRLVLSFLPFSSTHGRTLSPCYTRLCCLAENAALLQNT
jgi:hypothetical protein